MLNERLRSGEGVETDLADLSLEAVIELDRYLQGQQADFDTVRKLKARLGDVAALQAGQDILNLQGNPRTIGIFDRALHDALQRSTTNIRDLANEILSVFEAIDNVQKADNRADLQMIKKFCISLHEGLVSDYPGISSYEDARHVRYGRGT